MVTLRHTFFFKCSFRKEGLKLPCKRFALACMRTAHDHALRACMHAFSLRMPLDDHNNYNQALFFFALACMRTAHDCFLCAGKDKSCAYCSFQIKDLNKPSPLRGERNGACAKKGYQDCFLSGNHGKLPSRAAYNQAHTKT